MTPTFDPPRAPEEITVDWLTHALRAAGAIGDGITVERASVEAIGDLGGVNGETYRVRLDYAHGEARDEEPRSLIAKFPVDRTGARGVAAFQRWYEREVGFYTTLAATSPIRTPRCYAASIDANGDYVLLLEDLRPRLQGDQIAGASVEQARATVEAAAQLHARWWNVAPPVSDTLPDTPVGLDRAVRMQGALGRVWARTRDVVALPDALVAAMPNLVDGYVSLLRCMASSPVTVIHGDYRLDNLFFEEGAAGADRTDGGGVIAIDWQFVCRCRGIYDIGYFIGLDLDPESRRIHERDLLATYLAALRRHGVQDYDAPEAWDDYRRSLLLAFAVFLMGAAGVQPNERMARVHEVGLARLAVALDETDAFAVLGSPHA